MTLRMTSGYDFPLRGGAVIGGKTIPQSTVLRWPSVASSSTACAANKDGSGEIPKENRIGDSEEKGYKCL